MSKHWLIAVMSVAALTGVGVIGSILGRSCGYSEGAAHMAKVLAVPSVRASGSESATRKDAVADATAAPPSSVPAGEASAPAPGGSAATPHWTVVEDLDAIAGRWIGKDSGDAIPGGPLGGKVVPGGYRVEIVKGKPRSKTPWNVTVWAPRDGHMGSDTISMGCGFYPELAGNIRDGFCRGYGTTSGMKSVRLNMWLMRSGDDLRLQIGEEIDATLVRSSKWTWSPEHVRRRTEKCGDNAACAATVNACGIGHRHEPPSQTYLDCVAAVSR